MASTRSERPQNRKRDHPRPTLLETTRVDGVKAPQHRGTPRSHRYDHRRRRKKSRPRGRRPRSCGAGLRLVVGSRRRRRCWRGAIGARGNKLSREPQTASRRRRSRGDAIAATVARSRTPRKHRARTRRRTATAGPLGTATRPRRARLFLRSRPGPVNSLCRARRAGRIYRCETSLLKTSYIKARRRPGRAASEAAAAAVSEDCRAASAAVYGRTSCGGRPKPHFGATRCPRKKLVL